MIPKKNQPDPYNFPMPKRTDLMSLSVIDSHKDGEYTHTKKFYSGREFNQSLKTTDIEGAQPKLFGSKTVNKQEFSNQNWDIDRSGPRALHLGLSKPEYNLANHDIEHSQPDCVKFKTKRSFDPLKPEYQLSQVEVRPITPPKFIRDNIHHDDIDGSKPKKPAYYQTRSILEIKDIEGCKPRDRTYNRTAQFENINYRDVTHADFKTKRSTNPLSPSYMVRNDDGTVEEIGGIEGNVPNKIPERKKGPVSQILQTHDIEGAQTGTKGLGVFAHHQRKNFKETNKLNDIAGSTVGSLRKGVLTNRSSNPLAPDYAMPGSTEYGENNAFGLVAKQVVQKPIQVPTAPKVTKPPFKLPHTVI